jgi:hypothetical protein
MVLGCAGLLAIGLSITSFAGVDPDTDLDGTTDSNDNCVVYANGSAAQEPGTPQCDAQEDGNTNGGDIDGYGNPCDTDYNNDFQTGVDDLAASFVALGNSSTDPEFDPNCDGQTGVDDLARTFADLQASATPGPSGLACAGVPTCP